MKLNDKNHEKYNSLMVIIINYINKWRKLLIDLYNDIKKKKNYINYEKYNNDIYKNIYNKELL